MKNKKVSFIILFVIFLLLIISFFYFNAYKKTKIVNNINKSNIKEYILNISSYEAEIIVNVNSNKNSNKYKIKQKHNKTENIYTQEVIEPGNIAGLKIIYDGKDLKLENTSLNLVKLYEDYIYIANNTLDLFSFIDNYKISEDIKYIENDEEIIIELKNKNGNKYNYYQNLHISKSNLKPSKMEIMDMNQNLIIYIVYNEINFNNLNKDEIIAFATEEIKTDL